MSPKPLTYFTALSIAAHAALFGFWSPPERTAADHQESSIEIGLVVLPAIDQNFSSQRTQPARQQSKQTRQQPTRQQNKQAVTAQTVEQADQPEQARRPAPPAADRVTSDNTTAVPATNDQVLQEPAPRSEPTTRTDPAPASPAGAGSSPLVATEAAPLTSANPAPQYPAEALRYGWEGEVWLQVSVDRNGAVEHIRIDRSSGYPVLDRAARKTVQRWLFEPARIGEETIDATVRVPVRFKIKRS